MELMPVQCQNCGAQLSIDPGSEQAQCPFCGTTYAVKASGSTIGLRRITESLKQIDSSTSTTAYELRLARLRQERAELEQILDEKQQWYDKHYYSQKTVTTTCMLLTVSLGVCLFWALLSGSDSALIVGAGLVLSALTWRSSAGSLLRIERTTGSEIPKLEAEVSRRTKAISEAFHTE